jgi:hypothetical protein
MKRSILALVLGAGLAISPAVAQEELQDQQQNESDEDSAAKAAREGLESLMRALELMLDSIPTFEMPEILPNGDIIIRRVHPDDEDKLENEDGGGDGQIDETSY